MSSSNKSFSGQSVFITGAGRGIGAAIARAFARRGANVAINDHPNATADLQALQEELTQYGGAVHCAPADAGDQKDIESAFQSAVETLGSIDIAVPNAAYSDREPFYTAKMAGFEQTIQVTLWGAYYLIRAAANHMISRNTHGALVLIGSPHAHIPVPYAMAYNIAKAGVHQMAKTAATELIPHKIRVNTIIPGWIDTPGERKFASDPEIEDSSQRLPWGRMGTPEEIANGVVYLADPSNEYMTGSELTIDGGAQLPYERL